MNIVLITGGVRSGKSRYAERLAAEHAGADVTYLATCRVEDHEMALRVQLHRAQRPATWTTVEQPMDVAAVVASSVQPVVLLECLTLLTSNVLYEHRDADPRHALRVEVEQLLAAAGAREGTLIIVTNEVGCGMIPMSEVARLYCDVLGEANRAVAAAAHAVIMLVSGIPLRLKGRGTLRGADVRGTATRTGAVT
jgi:adenosylcobinamide kinase/adenosylcobinamide-phosphate guanylyltransferase